MSTALQTIDQQQSPTVKGETAASSAAAQAAALVQARYVVALQRPRDWDDVRHRLLSECRRPAFAAVAEYHKPIGKGVTGPSIRFVEAALRCIGNCAQGSTVLYDDSDKRIVSVYVTEMESNTTYEKSITISKTVERKNARGYEVLGERVNTYGDTIYIVRATDDDLLNKEGSLVSKALRTLGLRLIPGDLVEEGIGLCRESVKLKIDPAESRKRLADAFGALGVKPSNLAEYLGHSLEQCTPAQLAHLRTIYTGLKEGVATWQDYISPTEQDGDSKGAKPQPSKSTATADALKAAKEKAGKS